MAHLNFVLPFSNLASRASSPSISKTTSCSFLARRPIALFRHAPKSRPLLSPFIVTMFDDNGNNDQEYFDLNLDSDDYYALFGISHTATPEEIKKAYYRAVRACHPDHNKHDPDADNLCSMMNVIYETLSDPAKRKTYDEIMGFSIGAVNPFLDQSYSADKVFVDEFTCIGCKMCWSVAPNTFYIEDDYGRSRVIAQNQDSYELIEEAIDTCPVSCIHFVTAPQLVLLEREMTKIERFNVAVMNSGNSAMQSAQYDVFARAYSDWQRRAELTKKERENTINSMVNWWENMAGVTKKRQENEKQKEQEEKEKEKCAATSSQVSARTSEAVRRWRDFQRRKRESSSSRRLLLPVTAPGADSQKPQQELATAP